MNWDVEKLMNPSFQAVLRDIYCIFLPPHCNTHLISTSLLHTPTHPAPAPPGTPGIPLFFLCPPAAPPNLAAAALFTVLALLVAHLNTRS
jgi:hypothetical protein